MFKGLKERAKVLFFCEICKSKVQKREKLQKIGQIFAGMEKK